MLASKIHEYFAHIELDPAIGWEVLETDLDDPVSEVKDFPHLRRLLASYVSRYIDMAWDEESDNDSHISTFFHTAVKLLRTTMPLTYDESRAILGASVWFGTGPMYDQVRILLNGHPILPPSEA